MMTPRERYNSDPQFHSLVTMMLREIEIGHFCPTELRDAAMLAALLHLQMHVEHLVIPQNFRDWLDGEEQRIGGLR
jgi:hypothetical protein